MLHRFARFIMFPVVFTALLAVMGVTDCHATIAPPPGTAAQCIQMGRDAMAAHDIVAADNYFAKALKLDPANQNANFFRSITRLVAVSQEPADGGAMDTLGDLIGGLGITGTLSISDMVGKVGTGLTPTKDVYGHSTLNTGTQATTTKGKDLQDYAFNHILPKINDSIANIDKLPATFTVVLTPAETGTTDYVVVDKADLVLVKSVLQLVKATIEFDYVYDMNLDPYDLYTKKVTRYIGNPDGGYYTSQKNDVLDDPVYASFLKPIPGRGIYLTSAKTDLLASMDTYMLASTAIRARTASYMRHMIMLDPEMASQEAQMRDMMTNVIKPSINGTPTYMIAPGNSGGSDRHVNFSKAFDPNKPIDIRSVLPTDLDPVTNNRTHANEFPDPTMGGILDGNGLQLNGSCDLGDNGFLVKTGQAQQLVFELKDNTDGADWGHVTSGATVVATFSTGGSVTLYDDGAHGDGAANDGYYGNAWTPTVAGTCKITVTATVNPNTYTHPGGTQHTYLYPAHFYSTGAVVTPVGGTSYDTCATPKLISALPYNGMFDVTNNNFDPDANVYRAVWYKYTPVATGQLNMTAGSSDGWTYTPVIMVFDGSNACDPVNRWQMGYGEGNNSPTSVYVEAGKTIYILVGVMNPAPPGSLYTSLHVEAGASGGAAGWMPTTVFTKKCASVRNLALPTPANGVAGNNFGGWAISRNGFIPFNSNSTDLACTNGGFINVFVRDTVGNKTERITMSYDGTTDPDGDSFMGDTCDYGNLVVFASNATNLLSPGVDTNGFSDIFVFNRSAGTINGIPTKTVKRISMGKNVDGPLESDGNSGMCDPATSMLPFNAFISANGRYVLYTSAATNLVATDTNGVADVFVYDLQTDTTTMVSLANDGSQFAVDSYAGAISPDGGYALFSTVDSVTGTTTYYKRNILLNTTDLLDGYASMIDPAQKNVSDDGRFVAFNMFTDVYVKDNLTGNEVWVPGNGGMFWAGGISSDGATLGATVGDWMGNNSVYYGNNPLYTDLPRVTTSANPIGGGWVVANPPAPGNVYKKATSVTLTAVPAPGYKFTSWTIVNGTTTTPVTNPLTVTVNNNINATANFTWIGPVTIGSLTPTVTSLENYGPVNSGTAVKWTATASGGSGTYEYQFSLKGPGTGLPDYKVMQAWGTLNSWTWTTAGADVGNSTVMVEVRNTDDTDYAFVESSPYAVGAVLTVSSLTPSPISPAPWGTPVTWTATAKGGTGDLEYMFEYGINGTTFPTLVQDWSSSYQYTAPNPVTTVGPNYYRVTVRNTGDIDHPEKWVSKTSALFTVNTAALGTLIAVSPADHCLQGTNTTISATPKGGYGAYNYVFTVTGTAPVVPVATVSSGPASSCTWIPVTAGTYAVKVVVTDSNNPAATKPTTTASIATYKVNAPLNVGAPTPSTTQGAVGAAVTWKAVATGGTGSYKFQFLRQGPDTSGSFTMARDWDTLNTFSWTPAAQSYGSNFIMVNVKNSDNTELATALSTPAFNVGSTTPVATLIPSPTIRTEKGGMVTWTATPYGNNGEIYYRFWLDGVKKQDWSATNTWPMDTTAVTAGTRSVKVDIHYLGDADTKIQSSKTESYKVDPLIVPTLTASLVSPQKAGTAITFTAAATGGTGTLVGGTAYQYRFLLNGSEVQAFSATKTYKWTTDVTFIDLSPNTVTVEVKNADGTGTTQSKNMSYTIQNPPTPTPDLVPDVTGHIEKGGTVIWTADAFGGNGGAYDYQFSVDAVVKQTWSDLATYTMNTGAMTAAAHTVKVEVRNNGTTTPVGSKSVSYKVDALIVPTLTPSPVSPGTAGTVITFTAAATGGSGVLVAGNAYQFRFLLNGVEQQAFSSSKIWKWTPDNAATDYNPNIVTVEVMNADGTYPGTTQHKDISYTVKPPTALTVSALTANAIKGLATGHAPVGDTITWTAAAAGGSESYSYQFERSGPDTGGAYVVLQSWSLTANHDWKPVLPSMAGSNTIRVRVANADGTGTPATKSQTFKLTLPLTVSKLTPSVSSPVNAGGTVTWTAAATGGNGTYKYRFIRNGPDTAGDVVVQNWSTLATYAWKPDVNMAGDNVITVEVKNTDDTEPASLDSAPFTVIAKLTAVSLRPSAPMAQTGAPATVVTWTATAAGCIGNSYEYQFQRSGPDNGYAAAVEQDWQTSGTTKTWVWTPVAGQEGINYVYVWIKNAAPGNTDAPVLLMSTPYIVVPSLL